MDATLPITHTRKRMPLAGLGRVTLAAVAGIAVLLVYVQVAIIGQLQPELMVFAALSLGIAGIVAAGWRWTPFVGALWCLIVFFGNSSAVIYDLTHPVEVATHNYGFMVVTVIMAVIGVVAGVIAGVQNYRSADRAMPRWVPGAISSLIFLGLGALLVAGVAHASPSTGVDPALLKGLPAASVSSMSFDQPKIEARVGETVALRFENNSGSPHSFDLDEFGVHVPLLQGQDSLVLFRPDKAGTYTFYCGIPGHREAGMTGTLVVTP